MKDNRHGHHTITRLTVHLVWATKYRYHVLEGDVKVRCRDLLIQVCDSEDVRILSGVVSKDHVHMHVEYPPKLALSDLVKRLQGRSARASCKPSFHTWRNDIGAITFGESDTERGVQAISRMKWCKNIWNIIGIRQIRIVTRLSWNSVIGLSVQVKSLHF